MTELPTREEHEALEQRVDELEALTHALRKKVKSLEEEDSGTSGTNDMHADVVFGHLEPGERVTLTKMKQILVNETRIQTNETATKRAKDIHRRYPDRFRNTTSHATWIYTGDADE